MARLPRLDLPQVPQHIVQRGNNRQPIFFHDEDYCVYIRYLREALAKNNTALHAYVLMTNHVHLLATGRQPGAVSGLMQAIGRRYVRYINRIYGRSGTLFEGRFRSSLVDSERYLLACLRYIELNPVRAGIVSDPCDYRWSSYRHHIGVEVVDCLTDTPEYRSLGIDTATRTQAYKELCRQALTDSELGAIRRHLNKGCALGSEKFQDDIAAALGRRSKIVPQGRPIKAKTEGEK